MHFFQFLTYIFRYHMTNIIGRQVSFHLLSLDFLERNKFLLVVNTRYLEFLSHIAICKFSLSRCKKLPSSILLLDGNYNGISVCSKDLKFNVRRLTIILKETGRKYAFPVHERFQEEPWLSITHHMGLHTFLCSAGCLEFTKNFSAEIEA